MVLLLVLCRWLGLRQVVYEGLYQQVVDLGEAVLHQLYRELDLVVVVSLYLYRQVDPLEVVLPELFLCFV